MTFFNKEVGVFEVYLRGGQSFKVKAKSIDLKWDINGNITKYEFVWAKERYPVIAMPPQTIIGVRRIR